MIYIGMKNCITCQKEITDRRNKSGYCNNCYIITNKQNILKNNEQYIIGAQKIHKNRYDYNKTNYKNSYSKIIITCKIHGDFNQLPTKHLYGAGCPTCGKIKFIESGKLNGHYGIANGDITRLSNDEFIRRSKEVHGDKYDYSNVIYKWEKEKVKIICKKHGEFWKEPNNHINNKQGCPKCKLTKGELIITRFLDKNNIKHISQKMFNNCCGLKGGKLKFDFYVPSKNLLIEYDGEHHYGYNKFKGYTLSKEQLIILKNHDTIKDKYAIDNGIKLLRIPYTKIKSIDNILKEEIYGKN